MKKLLFALLLLIGWAGHAQSFDFGCIVVEDDIEINSATAVFDNQSDTTPTITVDITNDSDGSFYVAYQYKYNNVGEWNNNPQGGNLVWSTFSDDFTLNHGNFPSNPFSDKSKFSFRIVIRSDKNSSDDQITKTINAYVLAPPSGFSEATFERQNCGDSKEDYFIRFNGENNLFDAGDFPFSVGIEILIGGEKVSFGGQKNISDGQTTIDIDHCNANFDVFDEDEVFLRISPQNSGDFDTFDVDIKEYEAPIPPGIFSGFTLNGQSGSTAYAQNNQSMKLEFDYQDVSNVKLKIDNQSDNDGDSVQDLNTNEDGSYYTDFEPTYESNRTIKFTVWNDLDDDDVIDEGEGKTSTKSVKFNENISLRSGWDNLTVVKRVANDFEVSDNIKILLENSDEDDFRWEWFKTGTGSGKGWNSFSNERHTVPGSQSSGWIQSGDDIGWLRWIPTHNTSIEILRLKFVDGPYEDAEFKWGYDLVNGDNDEPHFEVDLIELYIDGENCNWLQDMNGENFDNTYSPIDDDDTSAGLYYHRDGKAKFNHIGDLIDTNFDNGIHWFNNSGTQNKRIGFGPQSDNAVFLTFEWDDDDLDDHSGRMRLLHVIWDINGIDFDESGCDNYDEYGGFFTGRNFYDWFGANNVKDIPDEVN